VLREEERQAAVYHLVSLSERKFTQLIQVEYISLKKDSLKKEGGAT